MEQEKVTAFIIGQEFPMDTRGIQKDAMDLRLAGNSSAVLIFRYEHPTKKEIFDFEYGKVSIGLHKEGKLLMVAADIDGVGMADCVYHLDRFQHERLNWIRTPEGQGMALHIMVVDEKNILRVSRTLGTSSAFTNYFADIIDYQQTEDGKLHGGESEFIELGTRAYAKYPSQCCFPCEVIYQTQRPLSNSLREDLVH